MSHTSASNLTPMVISAEQLAAADVAQLCQQLKQQLQPLLQQNPLLIGIRRGGYQIANWLHAECRLSEPVGALDISWHRDDLRASSVTPHVKPTSLPMAVDGRQVLLVDDILYTGRTIRAALNELFDYGRPDSVRLAVLAERAGRQLPVAADYCAASLALSERQSVKLKAVNDTGQALPLAQWRLQLQEA